jgi:PTH1 family peptidyl-tRNA hydrolase
MPVPIKVIIGLGNPGPGYSDTRHNAGFWFVDELVGHLHGEFKQDKKFHGDTTRLLKDEIDCRILKPQVFMNHSGRAVQAIVDYFDYEPGEVLIAHDEIDLPPGTVRLKKGGGHGGHNGLRDIIEITGNNDFLRLRIGVGHPGDKDEVVDYVLNRPSREDKREIDDAIERAIDIMPMVFRGEMNKAMTLLNAPRPAPEPD